MPFVETNPCCEQCQKSLQETGPNTKKCGKCGIMAYCSVNCRTLGFQAGHKFECRKPEEANVEPRKAVSQLRSRSGSDLSESESTVVDSRIYFVRISRDWILDASINGPFRQLEETFTHIARNLRFSRSGMEHFDELCRDSLMDRVIQIRAPLDADNDKKILIEILSLSDSNLKKRLPCPVYNVVCVTPKRGTMGGPGQIANMELFGSFVSVEEAEAKIKEETERYTSRFSERNSIFARADGAFWGAVRRRGGEILYIFKSLYFSGGMDTTQQDAHLLPME